MIISSVTWMLLGATIFGQTANRLAVKYVLRHVSGYSLAFYTNTLGFLVLLPFAYQDLIQLVNYPKQFLFVVGAGIVWGLYGLAYNVALETAPLSLFTVIAQLQTILVPTFSILILKDRVSSEALTGILLIAVASIVAVYTGKKANEITLFAILLSLFAALSGSLAVFLDSIIVDTTPVFAYASIILLASNISLIPFYKKGSLKQSLSQIMWQAVSLVAFLASYIAALYLYSRPDAVLSLVYPLLRVGAIATVVISILWFKEKTNWTIKTIAIILASIGAVLIKLNS